MTMSNKFPDPTYSPSDFAKAEGIGKTRLYEMWRHGEGPRFYWNGKCRRITHRARLDWQREREAAAQEKADPPSSGCRLFNSG